MLSKLIERYRRRPSHRAADLTVRASLMCHDGRLTVQIHSGWRVLLDEDGRAMATEQIGRSAVEVPLSDSQRSELDNPLLSAAIGSLHGKTVTGRLYLLDDRVEYLDLESRDGTSLTWSSRPGWCELNGR
jgi:hypothetical protein